MTCENVRSQMCSVCPAAVSKAVPGLDQLLHLLRSEVRERRPGGAQVAARLAELLLLQAIRVEVGRPAGAENCVRAGQRRGGASPATSLLPGCWVERTGETA